MLLELGVSFMLELDSTMLLELAAMLSLELDEIGAASEELLISESAQPSGGQ